MVAARIRVAAPAHVFHGGVAGFGLLLLLR